MRKGEIVFDGSPKDLNKDTLTTIYGEEDWDNLNKDNQNQEAENFDEGGTDIADREKEQLQLAATSSN
jgi:phosphonate transport system ATP-binding protein